MQIHIGDIIIFFHLMKCLEQIFKSWKFSYTGKGSGGKEKILFTSGFSLKMKKLILKISNIISWSYIRAL